MDEAALETDAGVVALFLPLSWMIYSHRIRGLPE
jgi:hypothetical protein